MKRKPIELHHVRSSMIDRVGWRYGTLLVQFHSGATYEYYDVPRDVYVQMIRAESVGKYFNQFVKDVYSCELADFQL